MANEKRASYGIDAPGVIRNLFIIGAVAFIIPFIFPFLTIGKISIDITWLIWPGMFFILESFLMLVYSLYGKFKHRDRMLNLVSWKGEEQVLDIGTGKGLLMIGAAKKLTSGKATGIDIWNAEDLTGNNVENALQNAEIEGVKSKIEIKNENAMNMGFGEDSFDVILSNLCLHNIYNKEGRETACKEIGRVLKKGGVGIISDFRHTKEYKRNFERQGLQVTAHGTSYFTTFPPLSILIVKK